MIRKTSQLLLMSAAVAMLISPFEAVAAPLIHSDFEDGSTTGWVVSGTGTLAVVTDPFNEGNQVMKWDSTANNSTRLSYDFNPTITAGVYTLSMDIMTSNTGGAGANTNISRIISLQNRNNYYGTSYNLFTNTSIRATDGNGAGGGALQPFQVWQADKWYRVTQTVNLANKTFNWTLQNLSDGGTVYVSPEYHFLYDTAPPLGTLAIFTSSYSTGLVYFDNVALDVAAIPEASTISLLGIGLSFVGFGLHRRLVSPSKR